LLAGCIEQAPAAMEQGVVLSAQPANQRGETTGAGAIAGVVVGAAVGTAIGGRGNAQVAAGLVGATLGGKLGDAAESNAGPPDGMAYTIRLTDGRVVTIVEHLYPGDPVFAAGDRVSIETSGRAQRVLPAA
jgi:outer membrane lipoprotein SlyB